MDYFTGNIQAFEAFHGEQDDDEYLDIKEDIEAKGTIPGAWNRTPKNNERSVKATGMVPVAFFMR